MATILDAPVGTSAAPEIRARRPLPGGRAVTGALLVATSLVGIVVAHAQATADRSVPYAVAARDLPAGTVVTTADVALVPMELPAGLAGSRVFPHVDVLVGSTLITPLAQGELVQASAVVRRSGPPEEVELSVDVDRSTALGGELQPGEPVDVLATYGTGADAFTLVVARRARVIRIGGSSGALGQSETVLAVLATRNAGEVLAITHAAQAGEVALVRAAAAKVDAPGSYRPVRP